MKEINSAAAGTCGDMQSERRGSKLLIQSDLEGHMCPYCGSRRYVLVFRMIRGRHSGFLAARCSRCRTPRSLRPQDLLPRETKRETGSDQEAIQSEING